MIVFSYQKFQLKEFLSAIWSFYTVSHSCSIDISSPFIYLTIIISVFFLLSVLSVFPLSCFFFVLVCFVFLISFGLRVPNGKSFLSFLVILGCPLILENEVLYKAYEKLCGHGLDLSTGALLNELAWRETRLFLWGIPK